MHGIPFDHAMTGNDDEKSAVWTSREMFCDQTGEEGVIVPVRSYPRHHCVEFACSSVRLRPKELSRHCWGTSSVVFWGGEFENGKLVHSSGKVFHVEKIPGFAK